MHPNESLIAKIIESAIAEAQRQRGELPQGEESRRLAIIITELEKAHAYAVVHAL